MIAFPKILQLGDMRIADALKQGEVEITEKIDGSMFGFGLDLEGQPQWRSKGQILTNDPNPPGLFKPAISEMRDRMGLIKYALKPGEWIFGETLAKPHHNTLSYATVPRGNLIVFGYWSGQWESGNTLLSKAADLNYDSVPILYRGPMPSLSHIQELLEHESWLGKEKIEGVVIRHLTAFWAGFGEPLPVMCKYVRADFKEKNSAVWSKEHQSSLNRIDEVLQQYRTEARWQKALQHLQEQGQIKGQMQDIPALVAEIERDVLDECKEEIMEELFKVVQRDLRRICVSGMPVWYKDRLAQTLEIAEVKND